MLISPSLIVGCICQKFSIANICLTASTVQTVLNHGIIFNEMLIIAHIDEGHIRTKCRLDWMMASFRTWPLYCLHTVHRLCLEFMAQSPDIFCVDAGEEMCFCLLNILQEAVMFVQTVTSGALYVMWTVCCYLATHWRHKYNSCYCHKLVQSWSITCR
jgi:hypothetical protein